MEFVRLNSLNEIKDLLVAFADAFPNRCSDERIIDDLSLKYLRFGVVECLVENGEIIAFSCFYCNDSEKEAAYISKIATAEKYRGRKFGKTMLDEVCRISKENGMKKIRLEVANTNSTAISFYERNGFSFEGSASCETQYMIKKL